MKILRNALNRALNRKTAPQQIRLDGVDYLIQELTAVEIRQCEIFLSRYWVTLDHANELLKFCSVIRHRPDLHTDYTPAGATPTESQMINRLHDLGISAWVLRAYLVNREAKRWR